jgi:hypothetical protein
VNIYTIEQLLRLEPPSWLIEDVLPLGGLCALYGVPGGGKSFIALDMALSIAAGVHWQGHTTKKGYVVYVSAEGGSGISKRVAAWLDYHHVSNTNPFLLSFVVSTISVHPDSKDIDAVIEQTVHRQDYQELLEAHLAPGESAPPLFVIVDTLARCFVGDENQQEDMGAFIAGLDHLREEHDATVLVVHHTNKMGDEERGSSAFRGACDAMLSIKVSDGHKYLKCSKQKDAEEFAPVQFALTQVPTWDSCVVTTTNRQSRQTATAINNYLMEHPDATQTEIALALGISQQTVSRLSKTVSKQLDQ